MTRVVHFEINADDPAGLVDFYKEIFEWEIMKWEGPLDYWLVTTGEDSDPGINGAIMQRRDASESTINTIDVPSVDEYIKKITEVGGEVVMPKTAVPGVGYMAYCKDPQGNTFGMMQEDSTAK